MILEHEGKRPSVDPSAHVAPTATICGDVRVGAESQISFGAVLTAEGGPIHLGSHCIVRENAVIRATRQHPVVIGDHVLIGPRAYLVGCTIGRGAFLATGATVFHAAELGERAEVRVNGIVHLRTRLAPDAAVPIGWIALGDPVRMFPPEKHEQIWEILKPLNFPKTAYGTERPRGDGMDMIAIAEIVAKTLEPHKRDRII